MAPSRSKNRRSLETQRDLISDLPKDVLYRIMERLPLRDAARMSLLSHKWQDIWTSIPHLVFDVPFFMSLKAQVHETSRYCDIVSKILLQHEGPILKFSMQVPPPSPIPDVAPCISYLSRNGLKEFSLSNMSQMNMKLSSRLFSCDGLEKLKLSHCHFSLPPNFRGFAKLMSLELDSVFSSHSVFNKLIANCSLLKKLVLKNCYGMRQMHIVIDAPSLQILILDWALFKSLELKSCENLVSASIGATLANNCHKASLLDLLKVLANSSKLETLCLRYWFCRVFIKERSLHSTFERLRNLELLSLQLDNLDDFSSLLSCIQSFSSIETLKIYVKASFNVNEHVLDFNPDCTLHHLRCATVGISGYAGSELKLVECLLACSPVLEELTVLPFAPFNQNSHSKMLIQLNRFRRVSQKVQVICPQPRITTERVHIGVQPAERVHVGVRPAVSSSEDDSSDSSSSEHSYHSDSSS